MRPFPRLCVTVVSFLVLAQPAHAAIRTWTGGGGSNNWTEAANWGGTAPVAGDELVFPGGAARMDPSNNNFAAGTTFLSLRFTAAGYRITGNALNLSAAQPVTLQATTVAGLNEVRANIAMTLTHPTPEVRVDAVNTLPVGTLSLTSIGGSLRFAGTLTIALPFSAGEQVLPQCSASLVESAAGGNIELTGGGTLIPDVATAYTGVMRVTAGELRAFGTFAFGSGDGSAATRTEVGDLGRVQLRGAIEVANERLVALDALITNGSPSLIGFGAGTAVWSGPIETHSTSVQLGLQFGSGADNVLSVTGAISGSAGITIFNPFATPSISRVTLGNPANAYAGETRLSGGVTDATGLSLGAAEVLPDTTILSFSGSSRLDLGGFTENVDRTSGIGNVRLDNGALRLIGVSGFGGIGGVISGSGDLIKAGLHNMILSGANISTGVYIAEDGNFIINGEQPTVDIRVGGDSSFGDLGGIGRVGAISQNGDGNGRISPGNQSSILGGVLRSADVDIGDGLILRSKINGTIPDDEYSQLQVTGSVTLQPNARFLVFPSGFPGLNPPLGSVFVLIDNDGVDPISGVFTDAFNPGQELPEGSEYIFEGQRYVVSYAGGTGNDFTLTRRAGATMSIGDASVVEGDAATSNLVFTVTRSDNVSPTSVDFAAADLTATAGSDYVATSGTLVLGAGGPLSATITVLVQGDLANEANETLSVTLSNPVGGATLLDAEAVGTIVNDDAAGLQIADVTIAENGGSAIVTVSRSDALATFSIDVATSDASAIAGSDYTTTSTTLSFAAGGALGQTVTVPVLNDNRVEPDEALAVTLSNLQIGSGSIEVTDAQSTVTIDNDDSSAVSIANASITEGNAGASTLSFMVNLSNPVQGDVGIAYASSDGSATLADNDYQTSSGNLVIASGATTAQIDVTVVGDLQVEVDETINVTLANLILPQGIAAQDVTVGAPAATGTIVNDDGTTLSIASPAATIEGDVGSTTTAFVVTLSASSAAPVTVAYATVDDSALAGGDYVANAGTLIFAPGVLSRTINVAISGDDLLENDESFRIVLSAPTGASIAQPQATATIDDDDSVTVGIAPATAAEGDAVATSLEFVVSLAGASVIPVSVQYAATSGSAMAGSDFVATNGTLVFAPGQTLRSIMVATIADAVTEPDETFNVALTGSTPEAPTVLLSPAAASGTIVNDDLGAALVSPRIIPANDARGLLTLVLLMLAVAFIGLRRERDS